ncbi:MAG: acylphosphatase [Marinilabiliaceae bacterium]
MIKRTRIFIDGKVQGVGFRYFVLENAQRYGIKGYVKNMPGGSVEIDAEGEREQLDQFLNVCRQGPPAARVDGFKFDDLPVFGYSRFRIRNTDDF